MKRGRRAAVATWMWAVVGAASSALAQPPDGGFGGAFPDEGRASAPGAGTVDASDESAVAPPTASLPDAAPASSAERTLPTGSALSATAPTDEPSGAAQGGGRCDANWFSAVYARTHQSVVRIDTGGGLGAGFVFRSPGYVATAYHVISLGRPIEVTLADGTVTTARIVATDPDNDVAILELDQAGTALLPLRAARPDRVELGAPVIVIGHPFALDTGGREEGLLNWSVSQGIISGRGKHQLQTDAAINPGNSGGPLIDCHGRVLGVVSAKLFAEGIGFVIPITKVEELFDDIGQVPPVIDAWRFSLGGALAIQANPDDAFVGFGIHLSLVAYDAWLATLRFGALWSGGEDELAPNVLDRSSSRMMLELDLQHRWLVLTKPFPWYVGLTVGGAAGRTTVSTRTVGARLVPEGCSGSACNVELLFSDGEEETWMGWPSVGVATSLFGNLDLSYAFLPDVTELESSPHRILMGLSF